MAPTLDDLQVSIRDKTAFQTLSDYHQVTLAYLNLLHELKPTKIYAPDHPHYIFYQYSQNYGRRLTRPLNSHLFLGDAKEFDRGFERLYNFLDDLRVYEDKHRNKRSVQTYLNAREITKVLYTVQQSIGAVGDSFDNPNQARKRIGQLFEQLMLLLFQQIGLTCESRTIRVPVPNQAGYIMSYELDLVISRGKAVVARPDALIAQDEVIGSVKTTSKDRIDKIFLDKFMLSRLLGFDVPLIAIFLHDVQRAKKGESIFGINSTFKTNHFLGYTVALNRLDGVYYVDLAPELMENDLLQQEIRDFQRLLTEDIWKLTAAESGD